MLRRCWIAVLIPLLLRAQARPQSRGPFNRVSYLGGTFNPKINPYDWNTAVTMNAQALELVFAGRERARIPVAGIQGITYGAKAYRRLAEMAALSVIMTPLALFGAIHKSKDHCVTIEYLDANGQKQAVLLQVHKGSYEDFLKRLSEVTGKKVEYQP
jgi:hypothetical protein